MKSYFQNDENMVYIPYKSSLDPNKQLDFKESCKF